MLTESQRKWLTEYIGECWHEWYGGPMFGGTVPADWPISEECKKCHTPRHFYAGHFGEMNQDTGHRTFTTWADLGVVKEAIERKGEWNRFLGFAFNSEEGCDSNIQCAYDQDAPMERFYNEDFIAWLISPSRFCELVCRWKGVE